ncbi:inositol polyphosphate kinase-domain-containing protein [Apiospora hydei]|uniref:Kinase n=1 Tax=Apiospora hydei TaxID=1337664 RepID=A0ABR1W8S3_9PEZI
MNMSAGSPKKLATSATFPPVKRGKSRERDMPKQSDLVDYNYAVAGHAGTLCDADGELFIKPCTAPEINFYESAHALHPDFAEWMPLYLGSLALTENTTDEMIHAAIPGIVEQADIPTPIKEEIQSHLHLDERPIPPALLQRSATMGAAPLVIPSSSEKPSWVPNKSRKITTDRAVVLENASFGYKKPNIMDAKLGLRLWADDAPAEKQARFDEIANETTHKHNGFRVAGMRVYKGSEDPKDLDKEGYRIYDKWWGRKTVNDDNLLSSLKQFIFNKAAGIDEELGKIVAGAFATDLRRVQEVLEAHESRMYSASLLFVFEGDGAALRAAIEETSASAQASINAGIRVDSGIGMDEVGSNSKMYVSLDEADGGDLGGEESEDSEDYSSMPHIYSLKLIDFAHAKWVPGQGPDENILLGVRSLVKLFEDMSQ